MEQPGRKKNTLKTISEALNISKTTVSLVLKGDGDKYRISKKTQARIIEYAEQINFEPDFVARALATNKTSTIGLVFPDVHEAFMSEMVRGIESVLYDAGFSIILSTSGFSTKIELRNIKQLIKHRVDGIIVVPYIPIAVKGYNHLYLTELSKTDIPVVFVDRLPEDSENKNWVVQDDFESAKNAVELMHAKGCRNIACLSFDLDASSVRNRISGIKAGLAGCGMGLNKDNLMLLKKQDSSSNDLYHGLRKLIERKQPIDGLIVTTGGLAHKIYHLSKTANLDLNGINIFKYGKDPEYFSSGMNQIIQPNTEMGRKAAKILLDRLEGVNEAPEQHVIESKFILEN